LYLIAGTLDAVDRFALQGRRSTAHSRSHHPRVSLATAERVTADFNVPQIKKLLAKPGLNQILREKLFRRTTQR
jgi:hypothetical protein